MTECNTPPSEEVEWVITWPVEWILKGGATMLMSGCAGAIARTAWLAHQQVKGAPAFGSCRVVRVETKCRHLAFVESKNVGCPGRTVRECSGCELKRLKHEGTGWESAWATTEEFVSKSVQFTPPHMRQVIDEETNK